MIAFLDPKIWNLVLLEMKQKESANAYKNVIMSCKYHTAHIGFIWFMICNDRSKAC